MRKKRGAARTNGAVVNPRTARAMLNTLKSYRDDFASVSLTHAGLTLSVTFNAPPVVPPKKKRPPDDDERPPTAIELTQRNPPAWIFEGNENA